MINTFMASQIQGLIQIQQQSLSSVCFAELGILTEIANELHNNFKKICNV